jgi:hypothetical protein
VSTTVVLNINMVISTQADVLSGLAARWTFNEGSNKNGAGPYASDSSGNGNTGLLKGATWVTGSYGAGVKLNGSGQYVSVNESPSLAISQQMSVSFWLYASSNSNVDPRVISKSYSWDVKLNGSNRFPQFSAGGNYAMLNYSLPLNSWQHVLFTFSQGTMKGYVNGVPVSFAANTFTSQSLPLQPYGLVIGTDPSLSNSFAGMMDDVRIYNRALGASEVSAVYSVTKH